MNGNPRTYSLRVCDVIAPVMTIEMEMTTKAANSTGWITARCKPQPRHWQEIVDTTPPSPGQSANDTNAEVRSSSNFHRLDRWPRQAINRVEHEQNTDADPQVDRIEMVQQDHSDRDRVTIHP